MTLQIQNRLFRYVLFATMLSIGMLTEGFAGSSTFPISDDPNIPWHITADEVAYDPNESAYTAKGNVSIGKGGRRISADYVYFNQKTMDAYAQGNVIVISGDDVLMGERIEINLKTETGMLYDGTIFLKENHFYIRAEQIQKMDKYTYQAKKASITTCDGDQPAWKITARNLDITIEGYGTVGHAALWAKNMPVLYTPFLMFPLKFKRQTGLLLPRFGYSDRKGMEYSQPLFWAINESSDATLYGDWMQHRGLKIGAEYRYMRDKKSQGAIMVDSLKDEKRDDGSLGSSQDWGYEDDNALRPNTDRYWLRAKVDQELPYHFTGNLDLDWVSDQDYLIDFQKGYSGFEETEGYFNSYFLRELDDYNDPVRGNRLLVKRQWTNYSLNAEALYYDDVINRRQGDTDETLSKLPVVRFDSTKQKLFEIPMYFRIDSEYAHFYSQDGMQGHRIDMHPRISVPYRYRTYFTVEPSLGLRETVWIMNRYEEDATDKDSSATRELIDFKVELTSELVRMFQFASESYEYVKHTVRPQLVYEYIPELDQEDYPEFDSLDRIGKMNRITLALTNTLTSKRHSETNDASALPVYRQFFRMKIEQSYDINEARETELSENSDRKKPFSPFYWELLFQPASYLALQSDGYWNYYDSRFTSRNIGLYLQDKRGDSLVAEHRFTRDLSESLYTKLKVRITTPLSVYAEWERNLHDEKSIRKGIGLVYETQCWSLELAHEDEAGDQKYMFLVNLFGLGGIGTH